METTDQSVAQALMEVQAAVGDIRVLVVTGYGNAGVDVEDSHGFQGFFQSFVQFTANPVFTGVYIDVDTRFHRPGVGFTAIECMGIGITDDLAVCFGNQVGIVLRNLLAASFHFHHIRRGVFKRNGRLFHIVCVNPGQSCRITFTG